MQRAIPRRSGALFELLEQRTLLSNSLHLVFNGQPPNGVADVQLGSLIQLQVEDAQGNVATTDSSQVTLAVESGPTGGALGGTNGVTAVNGIATFGNLWLTAAGQYTLIATDPTANSATSASFTITTQSPTVALASSNRFPLVGQAFTLSATVGPAISSDPTPTGSVTFSALGQTLGTAALVNGVATLPVSESAATGAFTVSASYSGDPVYATVTGVSSFNEMVVAPAPNSATCSGTLPTHTVVEGQSVPIRQKLTLTNNSHQLFSETVLGTVYLASGDTIDSNADLLGPLFEARVRLAPGARRSFPLKLNGVPTTVSPGTYHIVTELTGPITVASAATMTVVAPVKQLGGAVLSVGPRARLNGFDSATVTVSNPGNVPAIGSLEVDYYVSTNATELTRAAIYVGITPPLKIHLLAGQKTIRHVRVPMRVSGTYYLWAEIDPNNAFDVANNGHPIAVSSTTLVVT